MDAQVVNEKVYQVEEILRKFLPKEEGLQKTIAEAMNYSFLAGGKRLRPMMMKEVYEMFGGSGTIVEPFMAALEMIHTYSLIHDDLPCMDNDEYRRGRKTTHMVYGEGMAVLAGDGLLNLAYETAMKAFLQLEETDFDGYKRVAKALKVLADKAGIYGMVGGQVVDVEAEEKKLPISEEMLLFIHKNKTAALIEAAFMIGAILSGADTTSVEKMEKCAEHVGIAFQIQDDILDVTGTTEELGKPVGSDEKNNKQTYITIFGMERAKQDVEKLSEQAVALIDSCDNTGRGVFLKELILSLIHRTH